MHELRLMIAAVLIMPTGVFAEPVFLQHRVNDPINLLVAIPAISSPNTGGFEVQAGISHVNVFAGGTTSGSSGDEFLVLDGAVTQLELRGQIALRSCFSAAFDTRVISHSGGLFDNVIETWHEIFGLPDAGRDESPPNQQIFVFSNTGNFDPSVAEFSASQTQLTSSPTAFGDVWLSLQRPTHCNPASGSKPGSGHVRVGVKLPVGSTSGWASGGQGAVFADWHSLPNRIGRRGRVTTTVGASYSTELDERFEALTPRRLIAYGSVVFDYSWTPIFQSVVQLDFRSPTFDSELPELGFGGQIHVGLRAAVAKQHRFELSISEDIIVDSAPDVGIRFAYTYTP